jgi:hypothetical protein
MTERTVVKQSIVDDDAISLTSTVVSTYGSDDEFSVNRILAEKTESGKKKYLISWEGYPLEKCTWEPHKNINTEILDVWKERKSRESKGLDTPFNVADFNALLAKLAAEKAERHRRRKAKRKRQGRAVSPSASEADDSDSSIEASEEDEVEDVKPGSKRKSKSPPKRPAKVLKSSIGRRESTSSITSLETARRAPERRATGMSRKSRDKLPSRQASEVCLTRSSQIQALTTSQASRHSRTLSQSSSDTPPSKKQPLQRASIERPGSSSSDGPLKRSKPSAAPPAQSVWNLTSAKRPQTSSEPTTLPRGLPSARGASSSSRGRVATRGGGNIAHKNVFQAREPPKKRGNLLKNAMDGAKPPKKFSNMRLARKAELQARDLAEGAPDISALGGLFDPSRPDSMVPIRPENLRKTSLNMVSLDEPNPLFVDSRENSPNADDPWGINSRQPPAPGRKAPPTRVPTGLSTCYYWDKQQRDSNQPPCQMGTACRFLHRYAEGVPIAPAPSSAGVDSRRMSIDEVALGSPSAAPIERKLPVGPPQSTCFFWDRANKDRNELGCGKGDSCTYQHRYEEGMPIAPPPPGFVEKSKPSTSYDGQGAHGHPPLADRALPVLERATCYYWDRAQEDNTKPQCARGDSCTYLHKYEEGIPVAPPPSSFKPSVGSRDPSTSDFPPWREDAPVNNPQGAAPSPWLRDSGEIYQAGSAQEDVSRPTPDLNAVLQRLRKTTDSPRDPTDRPRPESPLKEVSTPVREPPSRPPWDPYNPTHAICHFWFSNGACSKGSHCKYIHGSQPNVPIAPSIHEQSKIFAHTPCRDFQNGFCKYTATSDCRFSHRLQSPQKKTYEPRNDQRGLFREEEAPSRQSSGPQPEPVTKAVSENQTTINNSTDSGRGPVAEYFQMIGPTAAQIKTRPPWNPFDPFNLICYFWHTNGECSKGRDCTFQHSDDPTLPIAPPPSDHASIRAAALREESAKRYLSAGYSSAMSNREEPPKKGADETRNAQSSLVREDPSSPRKPPVSRVNTPPESKATGTSRSSDQKPSAQSPLQASTSPVPQIKPRPAWNPRDPLNAICFFLATTGSCPEGRSCQYIHSNDASLAVAPSPLEIEGRPAWDPTNPLDSICYFLATTGSCTWGSDCKYIHSNDPTLAIAPSPSEQRAIRKEASLRQETTERDLPQRDSSGRPTCRFWLRDECRDTAQTCRWWHGPESAKQRADVVANDQARQQLGSPVVHPPSPAPNKLSRPTERDSLGRQTCRYWLRDDCKYNNDTCRFWHGPFSTKRDYELATKGRARERPDSPTKPTPTGPRVKSVSFAIEDDMPFVEEPESMSSSNPRFEKAHPQDNVSSSGGRRRSQGNEDIEMQDRVEKQQSQIPVRRNDRIGDIEMKDADDVTRPAIPRKRSVTFDPTTNSRSMAISERKLPPNPAEAKIAVQRKIKASEVPSALPTPSSANPTLVSQANQKIDMNEYRRNKAMRELGSRAKEVTFGLDETQSLILDFGDMSQALGLPWGLAFSGVSKVRFDQMCIAQDFQVQQGFLQRLRLWHGNLLPTDVGDTEAVKAIDKAADELVRKSAGLFSSFPDFLVLTFPAKKDEWKFLESTLDYPQDARLRYFIFQSNVDIRHSLRMNPTTLAIGAPYRDILVDRVHGLDYKKLLPIMRKQKIPTFYLLFPSTASQTADFIISWLRAANRSCKIYSSQSEGSWHFFTNTPEIDNGIVLIHESAAAELHRLPNLYSTVVEKNFTFWYLSESSSPYPLFPSTSYGFDDSAMGQLSAIRLFPHGCAFLLTPSFLVAEPLNAYHLLTWFVWGSGGKAAKYLSSTARTWKLVCCHDFADYILDLAISKAAEKEALELKHRDDPAKDAILQDAGLSFSDCNTRFKIHRLLVEFDMKRSLGNISEYDSDCDESDYPFVHASKHIDPDNEKALIDWFAGWTMRNLDIYKKFIVVGSSETKYKGNFNPRFRRMKEVVAKRKELIAGAEPLRPPIANFRRFSITKQSSASPMESPQSPMSAQKRRALDVAAKLSASPMAINNSKDPDWNLFDGIAIEAASSPSQQSRQNSTFSNAHSPHKAHKTGGINLDEQIMELITEETTQKPPGLDIETSQMNGSSSANPTPISGSINRPQDLRSPPQFDGADDQSVEMDLDPPMLGFDGAGDERPTSSSSNTSRSGIQSDETGRRFVPRSVRPNASARSEIQVRPGYIPPEDRDVYQIPSRRGSTASTPTGQSAVASPSSGVNMNMNVNVDSDTEKAKKTRRVEQRSESVQSQSEREDGEIEEVRKAVKEVRFEATTSWYRRVQKEGGGWEHIRVEGYEGAVKSLQINK